VAGTGGGFDAGGSLTGIPLACIFGCGATWAGPATLSPTWPGAAFAAVPSPQFTVKLPCGGKPLAKGSHGGIDPPPPPAPLPLPPP